MKFNCAIFSSIKHTVTNSRANNDANILINLRTDLIIYRMLSGAKLATFGLGLIFASSFVSAEEIDVRYKAFYSHVKKLNNEDTQDLQFAFGFQHVTTGKLCKLNSVRISTQKQQVPVKVSPENRFTMPTERALNMADATIVIDIADQANRCDMSVQLETKPELLKTDYSKDDLMHIYAQYQAFFNEMGSFLSFMMPTVTGLSIHFEDENLTQTFNTGEQIRSGMLSLNEEKLAKISSLTLPAKPLRITAVASK